MQEENLLCIKKAYVIFTDRGSTISIQAAIFGVLADSGSAIGHKTHKMNHLFAA